METKYESISYISEIKFLEEDKIMSMVESLRNLNTDVDTTEVFLCGMVYNQQGELTKLYARTGESTMTLYYSNEPYGLCAIGELPNVKPVCISGTDDESELVKYMTGARFKEATAGIISADDAYYGIEQLEPIELYKMSPKYETKGVYVPELIDCNGCDSYDIEPDDPEYEEVICVM